MNIISSIIVIILVATSPYKVDDPRLYLFCLGLIVLTMSNYIEGKRSQ